jgi:SAM-dependent methyltransferase
MLAVARAKVADADFRIGALEALPMPDACVDLVTCALALTHVPDLKPVMREFVRVLRPGGHVVLSDMHPVAAGTGAIAGFPGADITKGIPYVVNRVHQISDYIAAITAAGLAIIECREPRFDENILRVSPSFALFPDATRHAFLDLPYLLIWRLARS